MVLPGDEGRVLHLHHGLLACCSLHAAASSNCKVLELHGLVSLLRRPVEKLPEFQQP
jgi:tellurite resistance protein